MKKPVMTVVLAAMVTVFSSVPLYAEDASSSTVLVKMQSVLDKQDRILQELAEIKEELRIVKVRTTLNG